MLYISFSWIPSVREIAWNAVAHAHFKVTILQVPLENNMQVQQTGTRQFGSRKCMFICRYQYADSEIQVIDINGDGCE